MSTLAHCVRPREQLMRRCPFHSKILSTWYHSILHDTITHDTLKTCFGAPIRQRTDRRHPCRTAAPRPRARTCRPAERQRAGAISGGHMRLNLHRTQSGGINFQGSRRSEGKSLREEPRKPRAPQGRRGPPGVRTASREEPAHWGAFVFIM